MCEHRCMLTTDCKQLSPFTKDLREVDFVTAYGTRCGTKHRASPTARVNVLALHSTFNWQPNVLYIVWRLNACCVYQAMSSVSTLQPSLPVHFCYNACVDPFKSTYTHGLNPYVCVLFLCWRSTSRQVSWLRTKSQDSPAARWTASTCHRTGRHQLPRRYLERMASVKDHRDT